MFVRPKFGQHAGEIQFIRPDVARELIAQGRATDPRFEELQRHVAAVTGEGAPQPADMARDIARAVSRNQNRRSR